MRQSIIVIKERFYKEIIFHCLSIHFWGAGGGLITEVCFGIRNVFFNFGAKEGVSS